MASGYENLINNRTSTQAQSTSSTGDGTSRTTGNGILGKDDFLKLLLVQLQEFLLFWSVNRRSSQTTRPNVPEYLLFENQ